MPEFLADKIVTVSILAVPLLLALVCHELAHGLAAYALGDPTARRAGRLTLNPLRHLDPLGTVVFFIANIGWAKPVPVDPRFFKNPLKGMLLVALAGPGANFLLAVLFAVLYHALLPWAVAHQAGALGTVLVPLTLISQAGVFVNLVLGTFNLLPVPPLDGSNILAGVLPRHLAYRYLSFGRYGVFVILAAILLGDLLDINLLGRILLPVVETGSRLLRVPLTF
ncbi:MAG TPA: site-2 protease family protein [Desulfovibrio sp.]|jgi:Zn-dependent protease|uniref:site-2 protease family protein n=1 Tax=Desulfovibrio TaxID=872 RepID=UPI00042831A8|nr:MULTISPECIES: site-2 protease family protein [Desulfovibrio]MDY0308063.1 site-2 protease family protein [Desulfovibrionaceae bacterium]HMM38267.1 site-2 protease family protein [Desulfovibrio sp.]